MSDEALASERLADAYRSTFNVTPDPKDRLYRFWRDDVINQESNWATEMPAMDGECQLATNRYRMRGLIQQCSREVIWSFLERFRPAR